MTAGTIEHPLPFQWGVACGAILTEMHEGVHGVLGGASPSPESEATARTILASDWGIADRDGLDDLCGWLLDRGDRGAWIELSTQLADFDESEVDLEDPEDVDDARKKRFIIENAGWLGGRVLVAWDAGRLVSVAGWGFVAGMFAAEEAWAHVMTAARAIQHSYHSWHELAEHYGFGRRFCNESADPRLAAAVQMLTGDPSSPWAQLSWLVPLATPGIATLEWNWQPS